jgi:hypothetical protein
MNHLIHEGITEYPGDNATNEEFFSTVPSMFNMKMKF